MDGSGQFRQIVWLATEWTTWESSIPFSEKTETVLFTASRQGVSKLLFFFLQRATANTADWFAGRTCKYQNRLERCINFPKNLGARRVTWIKFRKENPLTLGATVKKKVIVDQILCTTAISGIPNRLSYCAIFYALYITYMWPPDWNLWSILGMGPLQATVQKVRRRSLTGIKWPGRENKITMVWDIHLCRVAFNP